MSKDITVNVSLYSKYLVESSMYNFNVIIELCLSCVQLLLYKYRFNLLSNWSVDYFIASRNNKIVGVQLGAIVVTIVSPVRLELIKISNFYWMHHICNISLFKRLTFFLFLFYLTTNGKSDLNLKFSLLK